MGLWTPVNYGEKSAVDNIGPEGRWMKKETSYNESLYIKVWMYTDMITRIQSYWNCGVFAVIYGIQLPCEVFTGKFTDIYNLCVLKKRKFW
jgi:hypothetical protein